GNNHAFVTATAALRHFWSDDGLRNDVRRRGDYLKQRLDDLAADLGLSTRGRGMMRGLDVGSGDIAALITSAAFARGLIIKTSGANDEIVKVLAPLVIEDELLAQGLDLLEDCVRGVMARRYG